MPVAQSSTSKKCQIKKTPDWSLLFSFLRYKNIRVGQIHKRTGITESALWALSANQTRNPRRNSAKQLEDLAREELTLEQLERVGFE